MSLRLGPPTDVGEFEISPTRLRVFRTECERKWAFKAFWPGDQPEKGSAAQRDGTELHAIGEAWQKTGTPPPETEMGRLFAAGAHLLPPPMSPGVVAEQGVLLPPIAHAAAPGGVYRMPGTIDLAYATTNYAVVVDYKTTKDHRWIKTEAELLEDEQCLLYGLAWAKATGREWIQCRWLYFVKGTLEAVPVEFVYHVERAKKFWREKAVPTLTRMLDQYLARPATPFILSPHEYGACESYGGCAHRAACDAYDRSQQSSPTNGGVAMTDIWAHLQNQQQAPQPMQQDLQPMQQDPQPNPWAGWPPAPAVQGAPMGPFVPTPPSVNPPEGTAQYQPLPPSVPSLPAASVAAAAPKRTRGPNKATLPVPGTAASGACPRCDALAQALATLRAIIG